MLCQHTRCKGVPGENEVQQQYNKYANGNVHQPVVEDVHSAMEAWHIGSVLAQDEGVGCHQHEENCVLEGAHGSQRCHESEQGHKTHDGVWVAGHRGSEHDEIPCHRKIR